MKYILGFAVEVKLYKQNNFNFRVISNNKLIDDISIEANIGLTQKTISFDEWHALKHGDCMETWVDKNTDFSAMELGKPINFARQKLGNSYPTKIFLYELDSTAIGDRIIFELDNADTNFTNSFMTKYAYIRWHFSFLLPKKLLDIKKIMKIDNQLTGEREVEPGDRQYEWPGHSAVCEDIDGRTQTYYKNLHGGRKTLYLPVIKKHGIHMLSGYMMGSHKQPNFWELSRGRFSFNTVFYKYLHIYKLLNMQNEDIRSNTA